MGILDVELGERLEPLAAAETEAGVRFGSCLCLVRLHGRPLGTIEVKVPADGLSAEQLAERIQAGAGR